MSSDASRTRRTALGIGASALLVAACGSRSEFGDVSGGGAAPNLANTGAYAGATGAGGRAGGRGLGGLGAFESSGASAGTSSLDGSAQGGSGGSTGGQGSTGGASDGQAGVPNDPSALCGGIQGQLGSLDVWSDSRGPFVLVSTISDGIVIWHKSAGSWQQVFRQSAGADYLSLRGFPGGDLIVSGNIWCGMITVRDGVSHCETGYSGGVGGVFVVSTVLAYALYANTVLGYDGTRWTQLGEPLTAPDSSALSGWRLWASDQTIAVTMATGEVFLSENGGAFIEQTGFPPPQLFAYPYPSVWGFSNTNLWVGTRQGGLFSYDGQSWQERTQVTDACGSGIVGMWGQSGVLYLYTKHELARWSGGSLEVVKDFPCSVNIRGLWGTSLTEIYLVASDDSLQDTACGAAEIFAVSTDLTRL